MCVLFYNVQSITVSNSLLTSFKKKAYSVAKYIKTKH